MKIGFYPKLAINGIIKNKRIYLPYLLTCVGMVMMTYIINYLNFSEAISQMPGASTIKQFMQIGIAVIDIFSLLFLFYSSSFLTKRIKREFGLYNILGMGKKNLSKIIIWESLFSATISIILGVSCGIAFSKFAELGLVNLMKSEVNYTLSISKESVIFTALSFAVIFFLLLINSLRQIWFSSTISLIKSESKGEKPPKANWLLAVLGFLLLISAYVIALVIKSPLSAIPAFTLAVIMVIVATYLLMISGSVYICKILQNKKNYYYKPDHFVSVSSMAYRMKRNGSGLASICILATMVLVMLSATSALFIGGEKVLYNRYPSDINLTVRMYGNKSVTYDNKILFENTVANVLDRYGAHPEDVITHSAVIVSGVLNEGEVIYNPTDKKYLSNSDIYEKLFQFYIIPVEDFNSIMNKNISLNNDEVLICSPGSQYKASVFGFAGEEKYKVKERINECFLNPDISAEIVPVVTVICPNIEKISENIRDESGESLATKKWYYGFNTNLNETENIKIYNDLTNEFLRIKETNDSFNFKTACREIERNDFYSLYGGIFYLGIILSLVFIFAAVLIIYYKQITEGYEDKSRFEIMQKVGMTYSQIRKSINSQLLTVFFLPLFGAGLHLTFAFPIIEKLLLLFNLRNRPLFIGTTVAGFLAFTIFYTAVYRLTSNAYYKIVSEAKEK